MSSLGSCFGDLPISAFVNRVQPAGSLNPVRHALSRDGSPAARSAIPWQNLSQRRAFE